MIQTFYLILKELISGKFITFVVFLSILLALISVGIFNSIEKNVLIYIDSKFETSISPNTIKVSNNGKKKLEKNALRKINKLEQIKRIDKIIVATMPMQIRSSWVNGYGSDVPAIGVPFEMIKDDILRKYNKKLWKRGVTVSPIPILITDVILKSYNDVMAPANGLPKLSKKTITGVPLTLNIGTSSIQQSEVSFSESVVVAGITDEISTMALILPYKSVLRLNRLFGDEPIKYLNFYIKTDTHKDMIDVASQIEKMGYKVEVEKTVSNAIMNLKNNVSLILNSIKYLIVILAIAAICFASIIASLNRSEYYRIYRILGASRTIIAFSLLSKYLIIGIISVASSIFFFSSFFQQIITDIQIVGIKISFNYTYSISNELFLMGLLIPLLSTIPALFRLYFKILGRD